jgi:hypothetical protein
MSLSLTETQILTALRGFLLSVLPAPVTVVRGLVNRTPEPSGTDFCVMTPILRERLETNIDSYDSSQDVETLTFAALTLTPTVGDTVVNGTATATGIVTAVLGLNVTVNRLTKAYFAVGDAVSDTTYIGSVGTVTGVAYGASTSMQPIKMTVQLDVHGPSSGDNAQIISTLLRDSYGVDQFATSGFDVTPLYASDPRQLPFENAEQQIEERWSIDAVLQCNPVVTVQQQYGNSLAITLVDVQAAYH